MTDPSFQLTRPQAAPLDRRTVTVLFADVVDSTPLIEGMDAERALSLLAPAVNAMALAVERFGGTVTHRTGDGLMALFGVPIMLEGHAVRACHAAVAMQEDIRRFVRRSEPKLSIRVGVNTGPVVVTSITDGEHIEYSAIGATVHATARLETFAQPGTICISDSVHRQVRDAFVCKPLGATKLKGFTSAQPVYELATSRAVGVSGRQRVYNIAAPLTGREKDVASLQDIFARLNQGVGGVAFIIGEPGLGKTRLINEIKLTIPDTITCLQGNGLSFSQRVSYLPFIEMLNSWFGLDRAMEEVALWNVFEVELNRLFPGEAFEIIPYLGTLLGMEVPEPHRERLRFLDGDALNRQVLGAGRRFFERLARQHPLALIIDDLHWIDGTSAALLEHLLPLAANFPILFCVLSRPKHEVVAKLREVAEREKLQLQEVVLAPLSTNQSRALIQQLIGNNPQSRRVCDLILSKSEGNPFYLEEVVRALVDIGVLVQNGASGIWSTRDGMIRIPNTIQEVVMARIDRLENRLKDLLRVASIIGRTFSYRLLHALIETNDDDIETRLASLVAVELIEEVKESQDRTYVFRHALAHEAVYESLLLDERRSLHARVAQHLSRLSQADGIEENPSLLAFHYAKAEVWDLAHRYMLRAANESNRIAADAEALIYYEEAVGAYTRMFGTNWDKKTQALIERRLGELYIRRGDSAAALHHFTKALSVLGISLPHTSFRTCVTLLYEVVHHAWSQVVHRASKQRVDYELDNSPERDLVAIYQQLGVIYYFNADTFRIILAALRCHRAAEQFQPAKLSVALSTIQIIVGVIPMRRLAAWYDRRALQIANADDVSAHVWSLELSAIYSIGIGNWHQAEARLSEAIRLSNQIGEWRRWIECTCALSSSKHYQGKFLERLSLAEEVYAKSVTTADLQGQIWGVLDQVETLMQYDEWEQWEKCDGLLNKISPLMTWELSPPDKIWHLGLSSLVRMKLGHVIEATNLASDAVAIMKETRPTTMYTMEGYSATVETLLRAQAATVDLPDLLISRTLKKALRHFRIYARVFPIAGPRFRLLSAKFAIAKKNRSGAAQHLDFGLRLAKRLAMPHEANLLQREIGSAT
jgi:class 3 adenylate cyclase/tetratricopeptide (TPR) repeat protein